MARRAPSITAETVRVAAKDAASLMEILVRLGVSPTTNNYRRLERVAANAGVDLPAKQHNGRPGPRTSVFDDEDRFRRIVAECSSRKEIAERMGLSSKSFGALNRAAARYGIDLPHGTRSKRTNKKLVEERAEKLLRRTKKRVHGARLKQVIFSLGLLAEECADCGLGPEWNGRPIVLQIDHIDGDSKNNVIENLRILCPNCHSQTETFAGRNTERSNSKC